MELSSFQNHRATKWNVKQEWARTKHIFWQRIKIAVASRMGTQTVQLFSEREVIATHIIVVPSVTITRRESKLDQSNWSASLIDNSDCITMISSVCFNILMYQAKAQWPYHDHSRKKLQRTDYDHLRKKAQRPQSAQHPNTVSNQVMKHQSAGIIDNPSASATAIFICTSSLSLMITRHQ